MEGCLVCWAEIGIADRASREINIFLKNPPQGREIPPHGHVGEGMNYRILQGLKGGSTAVGITGKVS
jgi:hypothetical protein